MNQQHVTVPLTPEEMPLETLKQLIENKVICDELPFELLANHYPSLLDEWYPGYPSMPREMNVDDPICTLGYIKNGTVTFKDFSDLKDIPISDENNVNLEGEYKIWLKREKDSWFIHVVEDVDNSI